MGNYSQDGTDDEYENFCALYNYERNLLRSAQFKDSIRMPQDSLCIQGPPRIGKTAVARWLARSLNRPFISVRFDGNTTPKEVVGCPNKPGKIIEAIQRLGCCNPVVLLEGIENIENKKSIKIVHSLTKLRTKSSFCDRFTGTPYDLSNVYFIVKITVEDDHYRDLGFCQCSIVRDEYTTSDKIEIARNAIIAPELGKRGLEAYANCFTTEYLTTLIDDYVGCSSGIVFRDQLIADIDRIENDPNCDLMKTLSQAEVQWSWKESNLPDLSRQFLLKGESLGLSVCDSKGILEYVRTTPSRIRIVDDDHEDNRTVADCVYNYICHNAHKYRIQIRNFKDEIKVSFCPGNGLSIGSATFLSLFSYFSKRAIPSDTVVSGQISVSGRIQGVGGVNAKLYTAMKNGLRRVILPSDNKFDVSASLKDKMEIVFVDTVDELLEAVLGADWWNHKIPEHDICKGVFDYITGCLAILLILVHIYVFVVSINY